MSPTTLAQLQSKKGSTVMKMSVAQTHGCWRAAALVRLLDALGEKAPMGWWCNGAEKSDTELHDIDRFRRPI